MFFLALTVESVHGHGVFSKLLRPRSVTGIGLAFFCILFGGCLGAAVPWLRRLAMTSVDFQNALMRLKFSENSSQYCEFLTASAEECRRTAPHAVQNAVAKKRKKSCLIQGRLLGSLLGAPYVDDWAARRRLQYDRNISLKLQAAPGQAGGASL